MPRTQNLPGDRVFGQLEKFVIQCPDCSSLILSHVQPAGNRGLIPGRRHWTKARSAEEPYNPMTGRITCPGCQHLFCVGIVLYRPPRSGGGAQPGQPPDQRWTPEIHRRYRQYMQGTLVDARLPAGAEQNVLVEPECSCPQTLGGWTPTCPVHGWPATERLIAEGAAEASSEEAAEPSRPTDDPDPDG